VLSPLLFGGPLAGCSLFNDALGNESGRYDVVVGPNAFMDRTDAGGPRRSRQALPGVGFREIGMLWVECVHVDRGDRLLAICAHAILFIGREARPVYT
jgi:hypothetical protein